MLTKTALAAAAAVAALFPRASALDQGNAQKAADSLTFFLAAPGEIVNLCRNLDRMLTLSQQRKLFGSQFRFALECSLKELGCPVDSRDIP